MVRGHLQISLSAIMIDLENSRLQWTPFSFEVLECVFFFLPGRFYRREGPREGQVLCYVCSAGTSHRQWSLVGSSIYHPSWQRIGGAFHKTVVGEPGQRGQTGGKNRVMMKKCSTCEVLLGMTWKIRSWKKVWFSFCFIRFDPEGEQMWGEDPIQGEP